MPQQLIQSIEKIGLIAFSAIVACVAIMLIISMIDGRAVRRDSTARHDRSSDDQGDPESSGSERQ